MSTDWDIDSYKTDYENIEHWELKKKFMLAHKDKFSEDELVSLAQVFANIEFLGCRYPDKTMIRVAELAKGVVEEFREQRKHTLKRTLIGSEEAASAKIKGQNFLKNQEENDSNKGKYSSYHTSTKSKDVEEITIGDSTDEPTSSHVSKRPKYGGVKTFKIEKKCNSSSTSELPLGNFVLFLDADSHPISEIQRSAIINRVTPKWCFDVGPENSKICKIYFNNTFIASGKGKTTKLSKENAAISAISKLRENYFAVKVKYKFFSDKIVSSSDLNAVANEEIKEDNIGRKLMKLMGWEGGGLGSKGQGIQKPVTSNSITIQRGGLGLFKSDETNFEVFKGKIKEHVKNWLQEDTNQDLVFSNEFTLDERKIIHEIAKQFSLKSKSYGKDRNRNLVVFKKTKPLEIVETLKKLGGSSDKYELMYPTKKG
ncbi:conserved hypothetical protein [Pediculus humanus corporis]|uniref:NF-kappa-B-repressing factor n=1 Tax=Pediculus humanus subsp. corporis TaxID=121224 RepID=E0VTP8_PEDHC|nr:uncharacterized protein Phum_PHUM434940 [Pediculus humanus corporis]EEB16754.1 conserved hypothetical protein [Pediculus humanus corporis]